MALYTLCLLHVHEIKIIYVYWVVLTLLDHFRVGSLALKTGPPNSSRPRAQEHREFGRMRRSQIATMRSLQVHAQALASKGFLATIKYIGVKSFLFPPSTRQSAARAKLSAVFCVPLGAIPTISSAPTS